MPDRNLRRRFRFERNVSHISHSGDSLRQRVVGFQDDEPITNGTLPIVLEEPSPSKRINSTTSTGSETLEVGLECTDTVHSNPAFIGDKQNEESVVSIAAKETDENVDVISNDQSKSDIEKVDVTSDPQSHVGNVDIKTDIKSESNVDENVDDSMKSDKGDLPIPKLSEIVDVVEPPKDPPLEGAGEETQTDEHTKRLDVDEKNSHRRKSSLTVLVEKITTATITTPHGSDNEQLVSDDDDEPNTTL